MLEMNSQILILYIAHLPSQRSLSLQWLQKKLLSYRTKRKKLFKYRIKHMMKAQSECLLELWVAKWKEIFQEPLVNKVTLKYPATKGNIKRKKVILKVYHKCQGHYLKEYLARLNCIIIICMGNLVMIQELIVQWKCSKMKTLEVWASVVTLTIQLKPTLIKVQASLIWKTCSTAWVTKKNQDTTLQSIARLDQACSLA